MNYEITPQVGFGPIKFGAAPEEIQDILGKPVKLQKSRIFDDDDEDEVYFKARRHSAWYGKHFLMKQTCKSLMKMIKLL